MPKIRSHGNTPPNKDLAVLALYEQGGALKAIDTEDVAMRAAELAPGRFRWSRYPEQINLEAVRVTLKDEVQTKQSRVLGGIRDGWMLTPFGLSWCEKYYIAQERELPNLELLSKELSRLKEAKAIRRHLAGEIDLVTMFDIRDMLRVDEYSSSRKRKEHINAILNLSSLDKELLVAVQILQKRFPVEWEV